MNMTEEEIVVYLHGEQGRRAAWYRIFLEKTSSSSSAPSELETREGEGEKHTISSQVAVLSGDRYGYRGNWAVIGDDIYWAGGWSRDQHGIDVFLNKDLLKHTIGDDPEYWKIVRRLNIPRAAPFVAAVGRKLALLAGTEYRTIDEDEDEDEGREMQKSIMEMMSAMVMEMSERVMEMRGRVSKMEMTEMDMWEREMMNMETEMMELELEMMEMEMEMKRERERERKRDMMVMVMVMVMVMEMRMMEMEMEMEMEMMEMELRQTEMRQTEMRQTKMKRIRECEMTEMAEMRQMEKMKEMERRIMRMTEMETTEFVRVRVRERKMIERMRDTIVMLEMFDMETQRVKGEGDMVFHDKWKNSGEIYDLDHDNLDYLAPDIKKFEHYDTYKATIDQEEPTQVVFYNSHRGSMLIVDASTGTIVQEETHPCLAFTVALRPGGTLPPGLQGCKCILPLHFAVEGSPPVFQKRTLYWFTSELKLYGYDMDLHGWLLSVCLQGKLPLHVGVHSPLLLGLPNGKLLALVSQKPGEYTMASLSVHKDVATSTLDVKVEHIQYFHPNDPLFEPTDGVAIPQESD